MTNELETRSMIKILAGQDPVKERVGGAIETLFGAIILASSVGSPEMEWGKYILGSIITADGGIRLISGRDYLSSYVLDKIYKIRDNIKSKDAKKEKWLY